jgi:hypothetical protein
MQNKKSFFRSYLLLQRSVYRNFTSMGPSNMRHLCSAN